MRRKIVFLLVALLFAQASRAQNITTVVGGGPNNVPANSANIARPRGMFRDSSGNLYVAADNANRVFKIDPSGLLTVVAGNGTNGFSGDGGPAVAASISTPRSVAVDNQSNVFVGEANSHRVRRVDAVTGTITTYAGGGSTYADGQLATNVFLSLPYGLTVDSNGNVYIADAGFARVRRIDATTHIITTVGGPMSNPGAMVFDSLGNLFVADVSGFIWRIDAITGIQTIFLNALNSPAGLAFDAAGNLFFSEENLHRVRRRDALTGTLTVVAGGSGGFSGDGGAATSAKMAFPAGISLDASGNLTISDSGNNRLRYVAAATGIISTSAGNGSHSIGGNGFLATNAGADPQGLVFDANGRLLLGDFGQVRRVDATSSIISAIAGSYLAGFSGDGGLATNATLVNTAGIAFDSQNNLYIMDVNNSRVRRVDATTGIITSVAGNGSFAFGGDGGPALSASFRNGRGVIVDGAGNIIIADFGNLRVRRVDAATGFITTMVGTGAFCNAGPCGDGGPAAAAPIFPFGFAFDLSGNLLISDQGTGRIRKVDKTTGIITSVAGTTRGFSGDGGPANAAQMDSPSGIALDASGNLYIADQRNNRVRKVDSSTGIISTIGGNGTFGLSGDGGLAVNARLAFPTWVVLDAQGGVLFSDQNNFRVRRIEPPPSDATPPVITPTVTGTLGNNGWYVSNVAVSWSVTDAESPISSTSGCGTSNVTSDTAGVTFTCSATSAGGTASQSVTIKRDATPPTIQATTTPGSPAASGWYNIATGAPTVSFFCHDATSGLNGPCPSAVTPGAGANQSVTGNISDQAGNPASVTVSGLNVDLTAPVIAAHGNENAEATSASGATVTYSGPTASDGTSGPGPVACLLASASVFGLGDTTITCNASDSAGNPATATTFVVHVVDTTPPDTSITAHPNPITNVASPSFSFEGTDTVTPPASLSFECSLDSGPWAACTSPAAFGPLTDGAHEFRVRTKDGAGNVDPTPAFFMWTIDTAPPVITSARTPAPNANGWNNTDVTVTFTCTDAGSGVGTPPISPQVVSAEGAGQSVSASCTDNAGNSASATVSGINIDKTPPSITIVAPVNGATFLLNQAAAASYTCNGGLSGIATCAGPVANGANMNMSSPGSKTFTVNATDGAGNTASLTNSYTVLYSFIGFLQPIDNLPVINEAKAGKTIPVKWQLKAANGNYVSDLGSMVSLLSGPIACDAAPTTIVEEQLSSPGSTVFRYDSTANQFVFNWQSASNWKGCRLLQLTLSDGTQQYAKFNFK